MSQGNVTTSQNVISFLPRPIRVVIDRIRKELERTDRKEELSVQDLIRMFYSENHAFAQHDREGSLTADIKGKEVSIYNNLADEEPKGFISFCLHFESNLYCFDVNREEPMKPFSIYKTKESENVSANPQWYIGKEHPFKWKRDKNQISMFGYSSYSYYRYNKDEEHPNRIIYSIEPLTQY
jgi:hypothetical protein